MTEHSRDVDNLLKRSGSETLPYRTFATEPADQNSQWSIITSVAGAKAETSAAPRLKAGATAMNLGAESSTSTAYQPAWMKMAQSMEQPSIQADREETPTAGFGHLFRQAMEHTEKPARGTPLKALLRRIAS